MRSYAVSEVTEPQTMAAADEGSPVLAADAVLAAAGPAAAAEDRALVSCCRHHFRVRLL